MSRLILLATAVAGFLSFGVLLYSTQKQDVEFNRRIMKLEESNSNLRIRNQVRAHYIKEFCRD